MSDTLGCGTALGDLHRWFDGDLLDEELARHVRDCTYCVAELHSIESQRDALASLSGLPSGAEAALDASQKAAQSALAELLAELAETCLPSRGRGTQPSRPWPKVRAEVTLMAARLSQIGAQIDTSGLPDRAPGEAEGAAFAQRCVAVLEAVQGRTARSQEISRRCATQSGDG